MLSLFVIMEAKASVAASAMIIEVELRNLALMDNT
jgi:hypothetical protein